VLEEVQGITGYLPEPVQRRVASGLSLPLSQVYGVTTFFLLHHEAEGRTSGKGLLGTALRRNEFQEEAFIGIIPREDD
jgi:hypothetical protein